MSEVKRYNGIEEDEMGAYVMYDDYAAQAEEIKRLRDILTDLIASHAWYTAREYKRDVSYNSDSPGYEEEEKALEIYREIFGEDQFEHLLNVCAALDQRRKPNG